MIGILIVSHGAFGEALIHCASHVLGKRPLRVRQVGITVHDDPESILAIARDLVQQLDDGQGVLVLTDMVGATPANIATRLYEPDKVAVVSGASLPMLVRALTYRNEALSIVAAKAMSGGHDGIVPLPPQAPNAATGN